jgi:hypothetical protein
MRFPVWMGALATLLTLSPHTAFAQQKQPLPPFVFDGRLMTTRPGQDATTAADLGVTASNLPARVNGFTIGATGFVVRGRSVALGLGAESVLGRGVTNADSANGLPFKVQTYISGIAGDVSVNFGHRDGWSYLSAGAGPMRIESFLGDVALGDPPGKLTVNFGGGARWFNWKHLGFGFDVRFYLTQATAGNPPIYAGREARRILVVSGGISIK